MKDVFDGYQANADQLVAYGFVKAQEAFVLTQPILEGEFSLCIEVQEDQVRYQVWDQATGEPYDQIFITSLQGSFVGQVRSVVLETLLAIRATCFDKQLRVSDQAQRLLLHIEQVYGGKLEFLWPRSPDAGVFRHQVSQKWYGVFMRLDWKKLDAQKNGQVEVLNLRSKQVASLLKNSHIYPAFHMNKSYWVSLPLDGSLADEMIFDLLGQSFEQTKSKSD